MNAGFMDKETAAQKVKKLAQVQASLSRAGMRVLVVSLQRLYFSLLYACLLLVRESSEELTSSQTHPCKPLPP